MTVNTEKRKDRHDKIQPLLDTFEETIERIY